jgi:hypothetical protein
MTRIFRRQGSTTVLALALSLAALCAWGCTRLKPAETAATPAAPKPAATATPTDSNAALRQHLHTISVSIDLEDRPAGQAFRNLQRLAAAKAPAGEPIGFLLCDLPKKPEEAPKTDGTEIPAWSWSLPITIAMNDVPVDDAIRYLCMSCGLNDRLEYGIIAFESGGIPHMREMITRGFAGSQQYFGLRQSGAGNDAQALEKFRQMLESYGVHFPPGSKISYHEQFQLLLVTLPPEEIKLLDSLLAPLCYDSSEMAMIETKIVRVPESMLAKLGIDPVTGTADWGKLAASPEVETLAGGAVTAMSGNEVVLEAGNIGYAPVRYGTTPITSHIGQPEFVQKESTQKTDRNPLPVIGSATTPEFGDPTHTGYQLHATPTIRDGCIINLSICSEYTGADGIMVPPASPAAKMLQRFASRMDTRFDLRDGASLCLSRKQVPGAHGESAWQFTLVTVTLTNRSGEPIRLMRTEPKSEPQPLASLDSPLIKDASAGLSAKLAKIVTCDMEPTADYFAFLQKLFQENGIRLVPPSNGAPTLPFTVGACGQFRLESLLCYYMKNTGLPARENDGKLVLGRSPDDAATPESRRVPMSYVLLDRLRSHFSGNGCTDFSPALFPKFPAADKYDAFIARIHDAFVAGMQVDPATTFAYDATEEELVITGREAKVIAEQLQPIAERFFRFSEQLEVAFDAVEIPRKELLKLARKNGFTDADALGNAGVLPAKLAALVRSSQKANRVLALSGMTMSGNESTLEEVQERHFPIRWDAPTAASPKPGEPLAAHPEYGDPTHLGAMLHVISTVRDRSIINLKFRLEKTVLDGWDEFAGTAQLENRPATPLVTSMPSLARLDCDTLIEVNDGATVQFARLQGKKRADSASQSFFGRDNVLAPDAKLGEERDLFIFVTARLVKPDGTPLHKK